MALGDYFASTLAAARQGASWAWSNLYRDLYGPVGAYLRTVGPPEEVEDLLSETFLNVARDIHRFDGDEGAFRGWVFTIARRRGADAWRARGRTVQTVNDDPRDLADTWLGNVETEALSAISLIEVETVIRGLNAAQRDVIMLRVVADLSVHDTAAALDRSESSVRVIQSRALKRLRDTLRDAGRTGPHDV